MSLFPGSVVGPYTVIASLGSGGMGDVYRARDSRTGADVAIKTLPPIFAMDQERLARFEREAKTLALLSHPNIARIHGVEQIAPPSVPGHPGTRGLVMELIEGDDLSAWITRGPIPIREALEIARQIADALAAAHEIGVIHRDLKPANVKVTAEGQVKVFDFGLAKFDPSSEGFDSIAVTGKGIIVGTASYMPPEQAKGKQVDARADVWAFGAVLFEMLSGRRAFPGKTIPEILAAVLKAPPPFDALPEETPAGIRRLLRRCLEKDRKDRPASMVAVRAEIDQAIAGPIAQPSVSGLSALTMIMARPLWDRRAIAASLLGVATISVMGFAAYYRLAAIEPPPVLRFSVTPPPGVAFVNDETQPDVALTPDQRGVIILGSEGGFPQYLVRPLNSFGAVALRGLGELPRGVTVSPDSKWFVYQTGARGGSDATLHRAPTSGGTPAAIARIDGSLRGASWLSSDTLVFATSNAKTGLASIGAGGGPATVLTVPDARGDEADHLWPHALPGDRKILFTIRREGQGSDVAVLDRATGKWRLLVKDATYPRYVKTGHLLYATGGRLFAVAFNAEQAVVTGRAAPVIEGIVVKESGAANFDVSPGGTLVYMTAGPASSAAPDYRVVLNWFEELAGLMRPSGK